MIVRGVMIIMLMMIMAMRAVMIIMLMMIMAKPVRFHVLDDNEEC